MELFNKKKMFITIMILSTIMVMTSTSWFSIWLGMEINMMSTIPFIFNKKSKESSEKMMIYFLIQTMGSIFLLTTILMKSLQEEWILKLILTASMMIKLGMPPFHLWMPEMLNKMEWITVMVMITIQKLNPLFVTSQLIEQNMLLPMIMIVSSMIGSISGINQISMNKIMAYSSINHMSWILMCMMNMNLLWIKYFIVYLFINVTLCLIFNKNLMFFINQMNMNSNLKMKIMLLLMMLNLGGMPPLPGFFMKWMAMEYVMYSNMTMIMTVMIMCSIITLVFYMRIMYSSMMFSSTKLKFNKMTFNYKNIYMMFMINMMLPLFIMN